MNDKIWLSFNLFELEIPAEAIDDICTQGSNDDAVAFWANEIDFSSIDRSKIESELKECGAWDDLTECDETTLYERLLWIGAWNYFESEGDR